MLLAKPPVITGNHTALRPVQATVEVPASGLPVSRDRAVPGDRVEYLVDLGGHLVGIDHRGAVRRDREGVRHLVLQAVDPAPGRAVHAAARGGGSDVQREYQRSSAASRATSSSFRVIAVLVVGGSLPTLVLHVIV
ncbi:hypothetical protein Ari01nite_96350 [Paractinoplanes rishiriensis]|uniref:Uncharacterized protein n=2 Tax=Paractinoplanes rishiriensis TaxID=1050105 RepID=A0A919N1R8_9ACTN|nr:hypothetical protein Ari01nite_96350 [Actinoplanes rishiriensis]